MCIKR
jgi:hypothetical protein